MYLKYFLGIASLRCPMVFRYYVNSTIRWNKLRRKIFHSQIFRNTRINKFLNLPYYGISIFKRSKRLRLRNEPVNRSKVKLFRINLWKRVYVRVDQEVSISNVAVSWAGVLWEPCDSRVDQLRIIKANLRRGIACHRVRVRLAYMRVPTRWDKYWIVTGYIVDLNPFTTTSQPPFPTGPISLTGPDRLTNLLCILLFAFHEDDQDARLEPKKPKWKCTKKRVINVGGRKQENDR